MNKKRKSLGQRWWRYKWSGPLTFGPVILLIVLPLTWAHFNQEFFSAWSCETIEMYLLDQNVPDKIPRHNDLTDEQHIKLHEIYEECTNVQTHSVK